MGEREWSMKSPQLLLVWLVLIATDEQAQARLLPHFRADAAARKSMHIVVVTEGDKIDGQVTVLESQRRVHH